MTTPRDDIAGLSERLRRLARITRRAIETSKLVFPWSTDSKTLDEAAAQLDSLLKERDSLQARVKELEEQSFELRHGVEDQMEDAAYHKERRIEAESRALRAEQERDEAYERLKPFAKGWWSHQNPKVKISAIFNYNPFDERVLCSVGEMQAAYNLVRRLAGPEKEKS